MIFLMAAISLPCFLHLVGDTAQSPPFRKQPTCQQLGSQEQRPRFITTVSTLTRSTQATSPRVPQFTPQMKCNWTWTPLKSPSRLPAFWNVLDLHGEDLVGGHFFLPLISHFKTENYFKWHSRDRKSYPRRKKNSHSQRKKKKKGKISLRIWLIFNLPLCLVFVLWGPYIRPLTLFKLLRSPTRGMIRIQETWLGGSEGLQTTVRPEARK